MLLQALFFHQQRNLIMLIQNLKNHIIEQKEANFWAA
jgi:hypothetical protein